MEKLLYSNMKNEKETEIESESLASAAKARLFDVEWLQNASICPILDDLAKDITDLEQYLQSRDANILDPEGSYIYTHFLDFFCFYLLFCLQHTQKNN